MADEPNPSTTTTLPTDPPARGMASIEKGLSQMFDFKAGLGEPVPDIAEPAQPSATPADTDVEPAQPAAKPAIPPARSTPTKDKPVAEVPKASKAAPVPETPATNKQSQWKELREARDRFQARSTELETEVSKLKQDMGKYSEYDKIVKERDDYRKLVREIAAERDPELVGPIMQKVNSALELAKSALPADLQEQGLQLLQQPPSEARDTAMEEIMEKLTSLRRGRFEQAVLNMEAAQRDRNGLYQQSQQAIERRQQAEQQRRAQIDGEFATELQDWQAEDAGIGLLRQIPGNAEHNNRAKEIAETAKMLFNGSKLTPREFARSAVWATVAPYLAQDNANLIQKVSELTAEIDRIRGSNPPLGDAAGDTAASDAAMDKKPEGMTAAEFLIKKAQREGVVFGPTM